MNCMQIERIPPILHQVNEIWLVHHNIETIYLCPVHPVALKLVRILFFVQTICHYDAHGLNQSRLVELVNFFESQDSQLDGSPISILV